MNDDDELDRAVDALEAAATEGPSTRLKADTLSALRRADGGGRARPFLLKLAAAVIIAACGAAIYLALTQGRTPDVAGHDPSNGASTRPAVAATAPAGPRRVAATAPSGESPGQLVEGPSPDQPSPPGTAVVAAAPWSITGVVRFEGEPPPRQSIDMSGVRECARHHPTGAIDESIVVNGGRLANVVVSVRPAGGQDLPRGAPPADPAHLDQEGCQYHPRVLAMRVGQPIVVSNSDPLLHNVHALTLDNPAFNFGQPTIDSGRNLGPMTAAEVFKVKCDFHPWMLAYVHVFDHPFYAVTGSDGSFAIPAGLPDGRYTLVAWHERLGERKAAAEVKGGKAAGADFTFRAP